MWFKPSKLNFHALFQQVWLKPCSIKTWRQLYWSTAYKIASYKNWFCTLSMVKLILDWTQTPKMRQTSKVVKMWENFFATCWYWLFCLKMLNLYRQWGPTGGCIGDQIWHYFKLIFKKRPNVNRSQGHNVNLSTDNLFPTTGPPDNLSHLYRVKQLIP